MKQRRIDLSLEALLASEARLQRVLDGSEQGYWDWDLETDNFVVSEQFEAMQGFQLGERDLSPSNWSAVVHPTDLAKAKHSLALHLAGQTPYHDAEIRCWTKSGQWKYILTHGKVVKRDTNGKPLVISGTHTDISARKQADKKLQEQSELLDLAHDAIIVYNMRREIMFWNRGAERTYGWSHDEALNKNINQLLQTKFPQALAEIEQTVLRTGQWEGELEHATKDNSRIIVTSRWAVKRDEDNVPISIMEINRDITERQALLTKLELQARQDYLTGLNNRGYFMELAERELKKALRYGHHFTVLMLDIDHFKKINDSFGHKAGDLVLKSLAEIFRITLREGDIVGRVGGEEFVVLLPETNVDGAVTVAERIRHMVEMTPVSVSGSTIHFTVSIGGSEPTFQECTLDLLLNQADNALYQAKNSGRNRLCIGVSCRTD